MMESANLHHHQLPDQSSLAAASAAPSCYGFGNTHFWTSSSTTSTTTFSGNSNPDYSINGVASNSRDLRRQKSSGGLVNSCMVEELGYNWSTGNIGGGDQESFSTQSITSDHQLADKIKEEQPLPKFTEMLNNSCSNNNNMDDYYLFVQAKNVEHKQHLKEEEQLSQKLLLKTLSSGCQIMINGRDHQISSGDFVSNNGGLHGRSSGRQFSQIYPSINISNFNNQSSSSTSFQPLDHSAFTHKFNDNLGLNYGFHDQMHQPHSSLSCASNVLPSSINDEVIEAKRSGSSMETKGAQVAQKKSRLESRTPCPPFKVRKEKLGDRIAALQQLVAPFGKTDTASVLMEAIGYIKFLQNQVETLSVPYMKSAARNKSYKTMQGVQKEKGNEEGKRDLRSRGLCLVPLSCMSYMTGDGGGGGLWPPPNFGGQT